MDFLGEYMSNTTNGITSSNLVATWWISKGNSKKSVENEMLGISWQIIGRNPIGSSNNSNNRLVLSFFL